MDILFGQLLNAVSQGAFYSLFAAGLTLIFGVLHLLNMAHGALFMWGAFTAWLLMSRAGLPFVPALVLAAVASGVGGVLLERVAFRPLRRRRSGYLPPLVSSLAVSIVLVNLAEKAFGTRVVRYPDELIPLAEPIRLGGIVTSPLQIALLLVALAGMAGLWYLVNRTALGRQIRAIEESPKIASLVGVNVDRVLASMFFVASALAGMAGVFIGVAYNSVSPYVGQWVDLKGFAIIILGGMGSVPGALIGGFVLGFVEIATVAWLSSAARDAAAYLIIIAVLVLRPHGLLGASRVGRS